jgi:hypothetical protein
MFVAAACHNKEVYFGHKKERGRQTNTKQKETVVIRNERSLFTDGWSLTKLEHFLLQIEDL